MSPTLLNFGSLNIDHIYRLEHLVRNGETLPCTSHAIAAGGKGLNQSIAAARAGGKVIHVGCVGQDGRVLMDTLQKDGITTEFIQINEGPSGHAIILVSSDGENAIVLNPAANHEISEHNVEAVMQSLQPDWILLQNETNCVVTVLKAAADLAIPAVYNVAPFRREYLNAPLAAVHTLIFNETEICQWTGADNPRFALESLQMSMPVKNVILTMGADGVSWATSSVIRHYPAIPTPVVDTTAAGDTFCGFYVAGLMEGLSIEDSIQRAIRAATVCVSRPGATPSIPALAELAPATADC